MMAKFKVGDKLRFKRADKSYCQYDCVVTILVVDMTTRQYKCSYAYANGINNDAYWSSEWEIEGDERRWEYDPSNLDNFVTRKLQLAGLL